MVAPIYTRTRYTPEELDHLRENYGRAGVIARDIARELGRTEQAIVRQASKLGLSRPASPRVSDEAVREAKWWGCNGRTEAALCLALRAHGPASARELAALLGRRPSAIRHTLRELARRGVLSRSWRKHGGGKGGGEWVYRVGPNDEE